MTRRTLFLIGLALMLLAIFGQFLPPLFLLKNGTPISLRTRPVDPFSVFRGEYVTLDYEIGLGEDSVPYADEPRVVYLTLEQKGEFYERVAVSEERPALAPGQVCIRGLRQWNAIRFPDIAQYFVEEGLGKELESARNAHRLIVDAVVNGKCRAAIKGVRLGPEAPQENTMDFGVSPRVPLAAPVPAASSSPSAR